MIDVDHNLQLTCVYAWGHDVDVQCMNMSYVMSGGQGFPCPQMPPEHDAFNAHGPPSPFCGVYMAKETYSYGKRDLFI